MSLKRSRSELNSDFRCDYVQSIDETIQILDLIVKKENCHRRCPAVKSNVSVQEFLLIFM